MRSWNVDAGAELVETHSAVLVSMGDRVYKLKKPVDLGFLDFTTIEARREVCEREVALNRRLAPDVYLGVATVNGVDGKPCEHLVVMRRMPADRRLSRCIERGEDVDDDVRRIAHALATLHEASPPARDLAGVGDVSTIRRIWTDGFRLMAPHVGTVLDAVTANRVEHLVHRYLDGRTKLFRRRIQTGWIRDGHGDLQADDIFLLPDGPRILDCIEFSDELRWGDALGDVAFLAMDLERLGRPDLADRFLAWHRELTADSWPPSLAHHYIAQRAYVRAEVMCIRHLQGDAAARAEANAFLELARHHLERGRVQLVLVGGLPGTGKSTVSAGVGTQRSVTVLRSDELRPAVRPDARDGEARFGRGRYSRRAVTANYRTMLAEAESLLQLGESVVLDASWADDRQRHAARVLAERTSADLVELVCEAPAAVAASRIDARGCEGDDPSEATPAIAAALADRFDPWPDAAVIKTDRPADLCVTDALAAIDV